jgi:hypothetical protein
LQCLSPRDGEREKRERTRRRKREERERRKEEKKEEIHAIIRQTIVSKGIIFRRFFENVGHAS